MLVSDKLTRSAMLGHDRRAYHGLARSCEVVRDCLMLVSDKLTRSAMVGQDRRACTSLRSAMIVLGRLRLSHAWRAAVTITTRLANQRVRLTASQPIGETVRAYKRGNINSK